MAGISVDNVMALRQSILQRNSALQDGGKGVAAGNAGAATGGSAANFTDSLRSAIGEVGNMQGKSGDLATAFERGETTDIAAVMLAKQQASVGFETTLQVRNKLLSAYKDIMSMPV